MDLKENTTNGSIIIKNLTSTNDEDDEPMTRYQFIFYVSVRGVLISVLMVFVSFLNISTIVVICKHRVLQLTSNALIVCFSVGHSLTIISATLILLSHYAFHRNTLAWKVNCVLFASLTLYQHVNNLLCITAISVERVYSIYFPLHSYKFNTFGKMTKVAVAVSSISLTTTVSGIVIGFLTGNLKDTSNCTVYLVTGRIGWLSGFILYSIGSVICITMSLLIVAKLIHRKRNRNFSATNGPTNTEYKITKMLITDKVLIFKIFKNPRIIFKMYRNL